MKLHNAMWPGLVGKVEGTDHPPISLDRMLELTANAKVDGQKFTFTEVGNYMGMPLSFTYACELTSADEAKCTRTLEGFEGEALVMKRSK